jgi:MFS family permease
MIAQLGWWPWSFWSLSMVCLILLVLAKFIIPNETPKGPRSSQNSRFDYLGCITGVSGLVLFNFALNQAPLVTWSRWYIPTTLALGLLSFTAFIYVELHHTTHPLIPLRGLKSEAGFALACIAAGWSSHGIWAYYLYLYLSQVRGHTALLTAAQTSPVALTGIFFALSTVYLLRKINVSFVMLLSMINFLLGSLLLALMPLHQTYWLQTFFSVLIMPGAMNLSFPAATILMSSALPREEQGIAASLVATMVNYCISCGLGFAGTVHRYSLMRASEKYGVEGPMMPIAESDPVETEIRARAIKGPWFFAVGLSGIGVLVAGWFVLRSVWFRREEQDTKWVQGNQGKSNESKAGNDERNENETIKEKRDKQSKLAGMDRYRKKSKKVQRVRYVL